MGGPWPTPFVASHVLLTEPGPEAGDWPKEWNAIRFDAMDILHISPFRVMTDDFTFKLMKDKSNLEARFHNVIRAARTKNPGIKIVVEQFFDEDVKTKETQDFYLFRNNEGRITTYADSVAAFISSYYDKQLDRWPEGSGGTVSARINGYEIDAEGSVWMELLTPVLTEVRTRLNKLGQDKNDKFSVSISPAWTDFLNPDTGRQVDYVNMQNYDGGRPTSPNDYKSAMDLHDDSKLIWGLTSEITYRNTCKEWDDVVAKSQQVSQSGIFTWRLNSNTSAFENAFQVWLYNTVKGASLSPDETPNGKRDAAYVERNWKNYGGRAGPELNHAPWHQEAKEWW